VLLVCFGVALSAVSRMAMAAAIGVPEQDSYAIAQSTGGEVTEAVPAISYYNPAGMVLIEGDEVESDLTLYDIHSEVNSTLIPNPAVVEGPGLSGHATGFVESDVVATAFGVFSLPDGIKVGFDVTQPNGGRVKYPADFAGNQEGDEALLTDVQAGLSVAVPVTDQLSVGGGPVLDYFQSILGVTQNLPLGLQAATPGGQGIIGHYTGKSYTFGYNVGALYRFAPGLRVGVDYRSKITHDTKGNELADNGALGLVLGPLTPPAASAGSDNFVFPQTVSFGVFYQVSPEWAVMANAQWENWHAYQTLYIADPTNAAAFLVGPNISPVVQNLHFRDAWTVGAAANYTPVAVPALLVTSGLGYDETPVPGATYRVTGLPDNNRIMLGFGGRYQVTRMLAVQGAYAHYFIANGGIDDRRLALNGATAFAGTVVGNYRLSADVFDLGLLSRF